MNNITNINNYLAHDKELLQDHFYKTFSFAINSLDLCKLSSLYRDIINVEGYMDIFINLFIKSIELHDLGKLSKSFQYQTLGNKRFNNYKFSSTEHSLYGAFMYIDFCIGYIDNLIDDTDTRNLFYTQVFLNSYVIRKHHSSNFGSKNSNNFNNYLSLFIPHNNYIDRLYTDEFKDYNMCTLKETEPSVDIVKSYFFMVARNVASRIKQLSDDDIDDYLSFLYKSLKEADLKATLTK